MLPLTCQGQRSKFMVKMTLMSGTAQGQSLMSSQVQGQRVDVISRSRSYGIQRSCMYVIRQMNYPLIFLSSEAPETAA